MDILMKKSSKAASIATLIVAFPCAIIFGRLSQKFESDKLITVCICAYFLIAVLFVIGIVLFRYSVSLGSVKETKASSIEVLQKMEESNI